MADDFVTTGELTRILAERARFEENLQKTVEAGFRSLNERFDEFDTRVRDDERVLTTIKVAGCDQLKRHLEVIRSSGDGDPLKFWSPEKKAVAGGGGAAAFIIAAFEVIKAWAPWK